MSTVVVGVFIEEAKVLAPTKPQMSSSELGTSEAVIAKVVEDADGMV